MPPPIMTPSVQRITLFFVDQGSSLRWSEAYWPTGSDSVTTAVDPAKAIATARVNIMAAGVNLLACRVSDEHVQRDSFLEVGGQNGFPLSVQLPAGQLAEPAEMPYSTILLRDEAGTLYHTQRYISGIADAAITDPPGPQLAGAWARGWTTYRQVLLGGAKGSLAGNPFGMLVLSKAPADRIDMQVLNVVFGAGICTVTVNNVQNLTRGDWVRLSRARFAVTKPAVNGVYTVVTVDPVSNSFTISPVPSPTVYMGGGTVARMRRILITLTDVKIRGETHRKRGGRAFLPLGRARSRT